MPGLIPQRLRTLPIWLRMAVWLAAFLSPSGYVLLVITLSRLQMPAPPEKVLVALFCLIPVVALLICGTLVWLSKLKVGWRVGWLALTVLAMLLQFGAWTVLILSVIAAAIAPG